jgi:hypothetical protein
MAARIRFLQPLLPVIRIPEKAETFAVLAGKFAGNFEVVSLVAAYGRPASHWQAGAISTF